MSVKISFLHYIIKWTRVILPVGVEKFELFCIFLLSFSFQYNCQLVKGEEWRAPALQDPVFYGPEGTYIKDYWVK